MRSSLRTLVTDLEIRARLASETLRSGPPLGGRSADAAAQIDLVAAEAHRLLGLDLEGEADAIYPIYQTLTRTLFVRESFELPFLVLHDRPAARAMALCSALLGDIKWPYDPIVVATFSTGYYWTIADLRVIAIPCGEEKRLLGVPDLCHELGHTVYAQDDILLVGDFMLELQRHLQGAVEPGATGGGPGTQEWLTAVFQIWGEGWLQEFVCDLIATYLVGPAFLRQHIRLRAMTQPESTFYSLDLRATHPADDARMRACLKLLERRGFETEATALGFVWTEMITSSGETAGPGYDDAYPESLLVDLARRVDEGCEKLNLRAYDPSMDPDVDIPKLANEAYRRLIVDPPAYFAWEKATLADRWKAWGV